MIPTIAPYLVALMLLLWANPTLGANAENRFQQALARKVKQLGNVSQKFFRKHTIALPTSLPPIEHIVYGATGLGYFKTADYEVDGEKLTVSLLPITYEKPTEFYAFSKGQQIKLATHKFSSPLNRQDWQHLTPIKQTGQLTVPYFLMTAVWEHPQAKRYKDLAAHMAYIVNAEGEIIWLHFPTYGERVFVYHPVFKKAGVGLLGLLYYRRESYFELINLQGKILKKVDPQLSQDPYVLHHDFIVSSDQKSLLTFGHKAGTYIPEELDIKKKGLGPVSVLGSSIQRIDLDKNNPTKLFNPFEHTDPNRDRNYFFTPPLLHPAMSYPEYERLYREPGKWVRWNSDKVHYDWNHGNSMFHYPGEGYLISFRNNDRVFLLSEDFKTIRWSLGVGAHNTFQLKEPAQQFSAQHHATLIDKDKVMVLDNHAGERFRRQGRFASRVAIYQLNRFQNTAKLIWEFQPTPIISAVARGSADYFAETKTVVAYFPSRTQRTDSLFEVDYKTRKPRGSMVFANGENWTGYRAEPHYNLGQETFLGMKLQATGGQGHQK